MPTYYAIPMLVLLGHQNEQVKIRRDLAEIVSWMSSVSAVDPLNIISEKWLRLWAELSPGIEKGHFQMITCLYLILNPWRWRHFQILSTLEKDGSRNFCKLIRMGNIMRFYQLPSSRLKMVHTSWSMRTKACWMELPQWQSSAILYH